MTSVKLISGAVFALALAAASCLKADTLAQWTFETSFSGITGTSASISGIVPEIGSGAASGTHAGATTVWSSPAGDGTAHSFSANVWATADYFQFTIPSTAGFQSVSVAYDQNGSATGPGSFHFAYSTDGSTFTTVGSTYSLTSGITWNSTTSGQATHESYLNLTALDNFAGTVYFRVVDDGGTSITGGTIGTGGTDRLDNFTITANAIAVPEPASLSLLGGFGLLALLVSRRRR